MEVSLTQNPTSGSSIGRGILLATISSGVLGAVQTLVIPKPPSTTVLDRTPPMVLVPGS